MTQVYKYFIFELVIFLMSQSILAQDPVDCIDAVIVCNSQQLNYNSSGSGMNDFGPGPNDLSNGCLVGDEHQSAWFQIFISPDSDPNATLAFTITPSGGGGEDYDFALYGPDVDCSNLGLPIRCSFAASSCFFCPETGLGMGTTDFSEGASGDGFVAEVETQPGESYILLVDNWLSSNQGFFLDWTGTALLSCDCTTTADITGQLEICTGDTTMLTVNGTNLVDFQWEASGGGNIDGPVNMESINATSPGTYSVTVTDSDDCTGAASVEVTEAPGPQIDFTVEPASCGQTNGAIDLSVSGGATPYSFMWSNSADTEDLTDIPAGDYSVTVTSADGCTSTETITVPDDNPALDISGNVIHNTSCLAGNGSISTTVIPAGSYTYDWSNGETTSDIFDLDPGTYTLTVTSGASCTGTASFTVEDEPDVPEIIESVTPSLCDLANGEIDITVTGGVPPYLYDWAGGETTEDLIDIPAGTYSLTVTGDNGCTTDLIIDVPNDNPPIDILATIDPNTSCGAPNGGITTTIDPPVSPTGDPYIYDWSNGSTDPDLADLAPGTYTLTVSGGGSCTEEVSFTVPDEPDEPEVDATIVDATCGQANGSIQTTVTNGVAPFTYLWNEGSTTPDLNGLIAGTYTVTVTGDNACSAEANFTVGDEQINFGVNATIVPNTSCTGIGNGSITVTVTPAGSYTYTWSTGESGTSITDLLPGTYELTVSAGGTCEQELAIDVPDEPDVPELTTDITSSMCEEANGAATVIVTGGEGPFSYLWSNGEIDESIDNVPAGTYFVTVTGDNGCTSTAEVTIPNEQIEFTVIEDITPNTSCVGNNGAIDLTVTPSSGVTFLWSNGESSEDIVNLAAGSYAVTVSAFGTCEEVFDFTVPDDINLPIINLTTVSATCGQANGSIDLTVSAGETPFTYDWSNGELTEDLADIFPGTYSVTVTDDLGCTATANVTVNNNTIPIDITGVVAPNTSCESPNGEISVTLDPPGEYTYQWSTGETLETIAGLSPGTYSVTVTLGDICTATASFDVTDEAEIPAISADVTPAICEDFNGAIDLTVTGSAPPYEFIWSNGEITEDLNNLFPGTYTVTVTASNACSAELPVNVPNDSPDFSISGSTTPVTSCEQYNGAIDLSVDPPGAYDFLWSNGETTEDIANLAPGEYTVTVTQSGSCTATSVFTITDESSSPSFTAEVSSDLCSLSVGSIMLTEISGEEPFTVLWSNGESNMQIDSLAAGTYTVTITDANGCASSSNFTVASNSIDIAVNGTSEPNTSCANPNGSVDITIVPAGVYAYLWSNGDTTEDLSGVVSGNYTVTVSVGSCSSEATFNVGADAAAISLNGSVTDVSCNGDNNGAINLDLSGGAPPFMFSWSPAIPGAPEDPVDLYAGEYTVTVTDQAGCSTTSSFTISEPEAIILSCSQTSSVSLPGGNDGIAAVQLAGGTPPYAVTWTPGGSQADLPSGTFDITGLEEGDYLVEVVDANGCVSSCQFTITAEDCVTEVGIMDTQPVAICGEGCVFAVYDDASQVLNPGDIVQFILHTGAGNQIQNAIARSDQPEFCFDPSIMAINTQYYISAIAGPVDSTGDVQLSAPCAKAGPGTPVIFREIPQASVDEPDQIDCDNPEIELRGSSSIPASAFAWSTEIGNILTDPTEAIIRVNKGGIYELIVSAADCRDTAYVDVEESNDYPSLTTGPAGTLNCSDSLVTLSGTTDHPDAELLWATISGGDTTYIGGGNTVTVSTPGVYYLLGVALNGCVSSAAVTVEQQLNMPSVDAGEDLALDCDQSVQEINAVASDGVDYLWTGPPGVELPINNTSTLQVDQPGIYIVMVTDTLSLCTAVDSIEVSASQDQPVSVVTAVDVSCAGALDGFISIEPEQGDGPFTIYLNGIDQGANQVFTLLGPDIYTIEVVDAGGCSWFTQVEIDEPEPLQVDLGTDIVANQGTVITLDVETNLDPGQIGNIAWTPSLIANCTEEPCTTVSFSLVESMDVMVIVTDTNGCTGSDAIALTVISARNVFAPNVFSPDGDGINDIFTIFAGSGVTQIRNLRIFSRWGELIYAVESLSPNDRTAGWDGTLGGNRLDPGVFVWKAEVEYDNGNTELFYGDVTLVR